MRFGFIECGSAAAIVAFALFAGGQSKAAEQGGVRTVAEELGSRTLETPADSGKDKLSDSAVRVMSTFALSILPDEVPDQKGKMVKIDKSNPNLYLIPIDDARHVIRVATRSAYAEVCNLLDLEKQNYNTLMRSEELRNVWTEEQMMFIRALHTFATSYFAGNVKITESGDDANKGAAAAASGSSNTIAPKKLSCSDEQRQKVTQAIQAYVATGPKPLPPPTGMGIIPDAVPQAPAAAAVPAPAPTPAPAPVAGGSN